MASLAAKNGAVRALAFHSVPKFAVVWIRMAGGTATVHKSKRQNFVCAMSYARFVAIVAGDRGMRSGKGKVCFLMQRDGKERAVKIADSMAALASIVVRGASELPIMDIFVAVRAIRKFHLVDRFFAGWEVAFGAFHLGVFPVKRILGRCVFLDLEERRLPAFHRVTLGTFALLDAPDELAIVNVFVAVRAIVEWQRLLEVTIDMARRATNRGVLPEERILGLRMIEGKGGEQLFPSGGGVAGLATLRERTLVRIDMAISASSELHVPEPRWSAGRVRLVAFFAGHLDVQSR